MSQSQYGYNIKILLSTNIHYCDDMLPMIIRLSRNSNSVTIHTSTTII